jgi:hypothetical protein
MCAARKAFGRIGRGILTAVASAVLLLWALPVSATVDLEAGTPGVAVENGTNVLIALPIENLGDTAALSVELRSVALVPTPFSITLFPAVLTSPGLPLSVGAIAPNSRAVAQLRFTVRGPIASGSFQLYGSGTYTDASNPRSLPQPFEFSISQTTPPPAPGSASLQNNNATSQVVAGGGFPHIPLPNNFAEANEAGPPVPTGPFIPVTPTKNGTAPTPDPGDPSVTFSANDPLDLLSGSFSGDASTVAEPSGGANGGGVIFATANWTAAYSTNGGGSFTQLDPTTIFPNDAVGYCCDQVVQYVPSIDRFIWLLQGNGYRIASASPAAVKSSGATAWTYWNLTPGFFGLTGSLDYPDMSVGNNYLYLSFDQVGTGLMVARIFARADPGRRHHPRRMDGSQERRAGLWQPCHARHSERDLLGGPQQYQPDADFLFGRGFHDLLLEGRQYRQLVEHGPLFDDPRQQRLSNQASGLSRQCCHRRDARARTPFDGRAIVLGRPMVRLECGNRPQFPAAPHRDGHARQKQ